MNAALEDYEHLLSADYRRLSYVKDIARYFEVTKTGQIIKHETMTWATPKPSNSLPKRNIF